MRKKRQKSVPFFNYCHVFMSQEEALLSVIKNVGRRGAFIMQKDLSEFERNLATYTGAKYAVGVANATDGMQMALIAGGIKPGDEIIISSHTMIATASAIHFAGAVPVPSEAGWDHLLDHNAIEASITKHTKAIMPTQLNGRTSDMDALRSIADKHGLAIYEDAAQSLGSKFRGKCAGTFGIASCISFYPAKILGCLGDGGAVITDNDEVYKRLLLLRDHGRSEDGNIEIWGFNSRLDNIQAAILDFQLKDYDQVVERRRAIASRYQKRLGHFKQIVLPPSPTFDSDHFDVFQNYEIEVERRNELKKYLAENGIGTLLPWGGTAVHQFRKLGFSQSLPFTEGLFKRLLMLPLNMSLKDSDVNYVCDCIDAFYA
jgi:dTDP-4-amino-4,6-dideoxygalactose transaminase